ncbi:hypothetical protein [Novilysobacter spongiicola]|uniref:Lipoprotein n=1 Tax=Lysobacter spongiicola DSM 21749 TaxID=1122188 RepID=A0A1T4SF00_9GAMM|nr:hypothetical protein [Lysobacter spongiicola]SKA26874.1 hypothetical protein SAMN02745674_02815 [Lysobacter spongiicola DSM 21749]
MGSFKAGLLAAATCLLAACGQQDKPLLVTIKRPPEGEVVHMTALLSQARLSVIDGCVRVVPDSETRVGYLGVFPYGFAIEAADEGFVVLDDRGRRWGATTSPRNIGGGELEAIPVNEVTDMGRCEGPYWIVAP